MNTDIPFKNIIINLFNPFENQIYKKYVYCYNAPPNIRNILQKQSINSTNRTQLKVLQKYYGKLWKQEIGIDTNYDNIIINNYLTAAKEEKIVGKKDKQIEDIDLEDIDDIEIDNLNEVSDENDINIFEDVDFDDDADIVPDIIEHRKVDTQTLSSKISSKYIEYLFDLPENQNKGTDIFLRDNFWDLRHKIYLLTNIPIYRQNLFAINPNINNNIIVPFQISLNNNDIKHSMKNDTYNIYDINIDKLFYLNRNNIHTIAEEEIRILLLHVLRKTNNFYVIDQSCNLVASTATGYSDVIGVAIDMDNRGWIVSNGSGRVLKYEVSGGSLNQLLDINVGDSPYNYSDMTGFRTPKILIVIGIPPGGSYSPTSFPATVDFTVALQNSLSGCVGGVAQQEDFCGNSYCEVKLSLSSTFVGGDYTLRQLNVSYRNPLSQITGGLVPCGRHCDDLETAVREDVPCTLCHILVLIKRIIDFATGIIAFPILVLMIIVGGITWITAGGSESRISRGKEIIRTAVIAIIILLAAWLIIDTVIVFLTPAGALWQNWSTINCPVP